MTLLIDANEPPEIDLYLQGIEVQRASINQTGGSSLVFPDYVITGGEKLVGVSRKQVGEILSNLDKCEEQLQRELAGPCEQLVLLIEGIMLPDNTGMSGYSVNWEKTAYFHPEHGSVNFSCHHYAVNPKHIANWQTRLEWKGVQVVHTYSLVDTAMKLLSLHEMVLSGAPNKVLERLIKTDIAVLGLDPIETACAKSLMGIVGAGIGEEIALTIAASFSSIGELMRYWDQGSSIADTMLRSGTRRVGHAAEVKLQRALGWQKPIPQSYPDLQTGEQEGQGSEVGYLPNS